MDRALFLHWGPGHHCEIEQIWHKNLEGVEWWTQPRFPPDARSAYSQLVAFACDEVLKLRDQASGLQKVHLIGHSFGCYLALEAFEQMSDFIESVTLLAPGRNSSVTFTNLAQYFLKMGHEKLKAPLEKMKSSPGPENFWPLISEIAAIPDFSNHYWSKKSAQQLRRYSELAQKTAPLDMGTFVAVLNDYFQLIGEHQVDSSLAHKVKVYLGQEDPLLNVPADTEYWRSKGFDTKTLPCGHFIQFERPADEWMPY